LATSWWILAKWRQSADAEEFPAEKDPLLILKNAKRGEQHDGGGVEEGSGGFEGCLEVLGEAAVAADPGEEALNDPAPGLRPLFFDNDRATDFGGVDPPPSCRDAFILPATTACPPSLT